VNTSVDEILLPKGLYPFYASTSKATVPHGVAAFVCENEKCVRSFVPPILSHLKAHVWPSSNHQITFPGTRVPFRDEYYFSPPHFCSVTGSTWCAFRATSVPIWICSTNSFRYPCLVHVSPVFPLGMDYIFTQL